MRLTSLLGILLLCSGVASGQNAKGKFLCRWSPASQSAPAIAKLRPSIQSLVERMNKSYTLSRNIVIDFSENNDPTVKVWLRDSSLGGLGIRVGTDYLVQLEKLAHTASPRAEHAALRFTLAQAMAETLIIDQKIPTTGRLDDCDVQFACLMLLDWGAEGRSDLRDVVGYLRAQSSQETGEDRFRSGRSVTIQHLRTVASALHSLDSKTRSENGSVIEAAGFESSMFPKMDFEYHKWSLAWRNLLHNYRLGVRIKTAPELVDLVHLEGRDQATVYFQFRHSALPYGEKMCSYFNDPSCTVWTSLAQNLNQHFKLRRDLFIDFKDIGQINAYYSPRNHKISFGYEYLKFADDILAPLIKDPDLRRKAVMDVAQTILLHELCHALIGELKLDATGREEDAADQFSAILLGDLPSGRESLRTYAKFRALRAEARTAKTADPSELNDELMDEHSLDPQRLTMVEGLLAWTSPENRDSIGDSLSPTAFWVGFLDSMRLRDSWQTLLAPHLKKPLFQIGTKK